MTPIAEELDRRLQALDPERAARCAQLVRDVLALFDERPSGAAGLQREFTTRTHDSGLMPGIDRTKLGQLADDL